MGSRLLIAGWSPETLTAIGLFFMGWIALLVVCALCIAGLLLFLVNTILRRRKIHVPGWANIVAFILVSALISWGLIHYYRLDTLWG